MNTPADSALPADGGYSFAHDPDLAHAEVDGLDAVGLG
jgi:hypothetical protein